MAQIGDEREEPEQAPADGNLRGLFSDLVNEPDDGNSDKSNDRRCNESVGDAPVMLESYNRTTESPDDVQVGSFGGERHGERGVGGFTVEAGATEAGSGKEMGDGIHRCQNTRAQGSGHRS